jgi:protein-disulfide isomerase
MSSRAEEKAARRAEREAAQAKQQAAAQRKKRLATLGGVAVLAAIVVAVAVVVGQSGDENTEAGGSDEGRAAAALVAGIPQDGLALGEKDAPLTIEEYIDYQCPFCGQFSREVFPTVIEEYIKTGKARVVVRTLTFLGEDSVRAARFATAAGFQNRQWEFTEAFFAQQGEENTGYVTDDFLRQVAGDAGVDYDKASADASSERVTEIVNEAGLEGTRLGINSTPSFAMGPTGGTVKPVETNALDAEAFSKTIDEQLAAAEKKGS